MANESFSFKKNANDKSRVLHNLSPAILLGNGLWFVRLRWVVVGFFIFASFCSQFAPSLLSATGVTIPLRPFYGMAIFLLIMNVLFFVAYKVLKNGSSPGIAYKLIYGQIFIDLIAITHVVHHVGSTETPIAFIYTLHIALACVFFDSLSSFLVTVFASTLYIMCITLEQLGLMEKTTIFTGVQSSHSSVQNYLSALTTISIFITLWYVVSKLSRMIRIRENELMNTQHDLINAHKEKEEYAKHTTHQLKSPLDCMRSNLSLVLEGYVGTVDEPAKTMLLKVENKAKELGKTIIEELHLSRLKADTLVDHSFAPVELHMLIHKCIYEEDASASKRGLTLNTQISDCVVQANAPQLKLLVNNLLTNAINYSNVNSEIDILADMVVENNQSFARLKIRDYGIGIKEDKIPYIFDEYFKTTEAVRHNAASSGIGLAIVRKVAELHNITINVESNPGQGTCFDVLIPAG